MWNRLQLKNDSKRILGSNIFSIKWLTSLLVAFILLFVTNFFNVLSSALTSANNTTSSLAEIIGNIAFGKDTMGATGLKIGGSFFIMIVLLIITVAVNYAAILFVRAPLEVGVCRYFLAMRDPYDGKAPTLKLIFSCFKKDEYMKIVRSWGYTEIILELWALIPLVGIVLAIVKRVENIYFPFIVAENPELTHDQAEKISLDLVEGDRTNIFVLVLSFIWWYLLCMVFPIAALWVVPYVFLSIANLYDFKRKIAVAGGQYMPETFDMFRDGDPTDPFKTPFDPNVYYNRNRHYSRGFRL